ncbi:molybdopterin biosynthesis protein [Halobacteriales archaeon QS_4_69_34]|nr:MAG: molybdopterin biosynthesis protein [Halobacteriales archaeon QS_4_69_34]
MSDRKEFRELASPEAARAAIAALDLDPGVETVGLAEARGRVLAERVDAGIDVPGFDRSGLDGYALRAADTAGASEADPAVLDVVGVVEAGERPGVEVGPGEAAEISTGSVMPPGADAMVPVERTDERPSSPEPDERGGDEGSDGRAVAVRTALTPGENVMAAGADVAAGERALGPGTRLSAREVGLLSALGVSAVPVRRKPRVGIVSTGDELVRPGGELDHDAGRIYDVNSYTTATGVAEAGGEPVLYPHAGDDRAEMERLLREAAAECELVLSSGSTSASAVDVIYRVVEEGGELLLHGVAIKPGKPMLVGRFADAAYVGLPGYPVSALSVFRTFVAPAIRRAAGVPESAAAVVEGRMAVRERHPEGRLRLAPVGLVTDGDGRTLVYPVDKGSGATTSLVEADGIVEIDPEVAYLDAGEAVEVKPFSPETRPPTVLGVGEDDPLLSGLLDSLDRPRYLAPGSREGLRWLREDIADVAVVAADGHDGDVESDLGFEPVALGGWTREWGLVVPAGNPEGVAGLADLVDRELRFVNRERNSGLRTSLADALAALADERGIDRHDLLDAIDGFDRTRRAHESPARLVASGAADAGLGLRATAARLDLGFVPLGEQRVRALVNPDRAGKPGVEALEAAIVNAADAIDALAGYGGGSPRS